MSRGSALFDYPEALGDDERFIVDHGGAVQEFAYSVASEELFVGCAPLCRVGVAASFSPREVVVDLLDGNNTYLDEFDRDRRSAFRVEYGEPLTSLRHCLSGMFMDFKKSGERCLVTAQDRSHSTVTLRTGEGEFQDRKVVVFHGGEATELKPKPVPPVEELEHALVEAVVVDGRWWVRFTEDIRHTTPYDDGEGFDATIEEALRAAIRDSYANLFEPGRDPQSIFSSPPSPRRAESSLGGEPARPYGDLPLDPLDIIDRAVAMRGN